MLQNAPECSRMLQNAPETPECSGMLQAALATLEYLFYFSNAGGMISIMLHQRFFRITFSSSSYPPPLQPSPHPPPHPHLILISHAPISIQSHLSARIDSSINCLFLAQLSIETSRKGIFTPSPTPPRPAPPRPAPSPINQLSIARALNIDWQRN